MSFFRRQQAADVFPEDDGIDPELRLHTVRTAASTIAESVRQEDRQQKRKLSMRGKAFLKRLSQKRKTRMPVVPEAEAEEGEVKAPQISGPRRKVFVNMALPRDEVDSKGEPIVRYARNKVRTSKYTILTFVPKNLYEQFRRVANIYFLALVILQVFSIFGATTPQLAALPLIFILCVTAIKDGIEDYRRARLDEEVNTSASTKLGQWRNMNQPTDPRSWFEKIFRINKPGKVTKGVRRLREREAQEGMQIVLSKGLEGELYAVRSSTDPNLSFSSLPPFDATKFSDSPGSSPKPPSPEYHSYPPTAGEASDAAAPGHRSPLKSWSGGSGSLAAYEQSVRSRQSMGVVNNGERVIGFARWERTLWKKLEVGDIVLLRENEQIPADIVVLSTSDPDNMCYVETKNLDGETNLKPRKSVRATSGITSEEDVERSSFVLDSEPPHQNLYLYHGVLRYRDIENGNLKQESVSINEMLLRGCTLRNTAWVIGLVVFTGADTKIMLNGGATPSKRSKIEKETNFNVIVNFAVLIIMCLICGIANGLFDAKTGTSADFFEVGSDASTSSVVNGIVTFVSCLIAFQNIVPISLYISIEIVKTIQAFFISQDVDMYYKPLNAACTPKTWNISDDLGQIEYIFSDKTGTLTQNIMEFQKCSVHGITYGEGVTEAQRGAAKRAGKEDGLNPVDQEHELRLLKEEMLMKMSRTFKNRYLQHEKLTLISPQLADDLGNEGSEQRQHLIAFFRALAICHSVLSDRPEPHERPFQLEYKAESPDEAALVAAARDVGFPFVQKSRDGIDIEIMGQPERHTLLQMIEFNSTRKRMSVIVRDPQGRLVLYCKGADSVIYQRLAADHDPELKAKTAADMEAFANGGLRTLCIAYRYLDEKEYLDWQAVYDAATNSINDRDAAIDKANEQIEHSLYILGATALEDKLQEGVPEAIETLHNAGIKLWILTGDKIQTAVEIGDCNLLKNNMDIMILSAETFGAAQIQIEAGLNKIASVLGPPNLNKENRGFVVGAQASFAIVIDGDTLRFALSSELKRLFLDLATQCETVVCCRVSPAQKAQVVKLVKEGRNAMTLSIGDGANDVAMIQEANIGCGLLGLEGSQAAMSADYAFAQFRYLTKLLIVHGRWSYQRIADMHSNFFYKNVIWTFAMFWFQCFSSFDSTYLYEYTFILLYNLLFTSLPVIVLGAFDQDINAKAALAYPQLYIRGIRGLEYTRLKFWLYMLDGLYQSVVVFFIPYATWSAGLALSWNGKAYQSLYDFGTTVAVCAIFAANFYVGLNTRYWTVITWVIVIGSCVVMVLWVTVYSFFETFDFSDEVIVLFGEVSFWATVLVAVVVALAPRFIVKFVKSTYRPLDRDIVREMWVLGDLKDRLGLERRRNKKKHRLSIEKAPMFHQPHYRSESEVSDILGVPVQDESISTDSISPPPSASLAGRPATHDAFYESVNQAEMFNGKGNSRNSAEVRVSYYSANDIPAPSPVSPTRANRGLHHPHMSSVSSDPVSRSTPPPPPARQAGGRRRPESYEMHVRGPSGEWQHPANQSHPSQVADEFSRVSAVDVRPVEEDLTRRHREDLLQHHEEVYGEAL
ncbi:phospholipid-translocating P-type ATPase [Laetiporus sulphureus 93-53]|uniref:Phospholipid-transporting ATPase n=1 Tax=Laetiporus sulphureus 93-53 TaxID=1314785 RepID=A0A165EBY7_9APHY|nr:phospholipid-translocating P-type ATPase [Laetiporus sulphureus 93-53]KZT06691.1 phospholipid-translocating P-type ATPase [Laetiporus sulphureus 93-53]